VFFHFNILIIVVVIFLLRGVECGGLGDHTMALLLVESHGHHGSLLYFLRESHEL
jgi:hypothetical protein